MALTLMIGVVSCSSETKDSAKDTAESAADDASKTASSLGDAADEKADEAKARVAAEDLRARIKASDTADQQGTRSVDAINESIEDVAGDPTLVGVADSDGDGLDDDGKVQVDVGSASACLTLPTTGEDTKVKGGAC